VETIRGFLTRHSGIRRLSLRQWLELGGLVVALLAIGALVRRRLRRWSARHGAGVSFSGRFSRALVAVYGHYVPHFLASIGAALTLLFMTRGLVPVPFVSVVAYGLPFYFLLLSLVHLFLAPYRPGDTLLVLDADLSRALARRLQVLALLIFFGYLLFAILLEQSFPEPALLTSRAVFAGVFVLNLIWVLWLLGHIPRLEELSWFRAGLTLVLLSALAVEWLGYRNLSVFILAAVVGTLLAIGLFLLLSQLVGELFDGLDEGRHRWQRQVRRFIGLKPNGPIRGLAWLRLLATLGLWFGLAVVLLRIWGLSDSGVERLRSYLTDGFTVGSLTIIPARVALAVLSLALVLTVSGWIRTRMERSWLTKTRMDRGAREALVTISGYLGAAAAILLALAVAGVNFGSLAIIAGALSVGIGFGLQNIVNNFVSGLILLFERPIKTGDWVVVGDTQGYVKRISIRSTQIQTFDQADVIVPNSDLISNQVTNWMLRDPRGRIIVPVGVAYGSDTEQVRDIMLAVAKEHPLVITHEPLLEAKVLFRGFGDSALNFELRCFIHYIDQLIQVTSDLNFAIDKAFREHGISIPFPQRDLHVRDWPQPASEPEPRAAPEDEEPMRPADRNSSDAL
jgi:potassium efflux system protein